MMHAKCVTKAERFANEFRRLTANTPNASRFTITRKDHEDDWSFSSVVTIEDAEIGGVLWVQWYSSRESPNTARFLGGNYRWTLLSKDRRIRRSYRRLWPVVHTFIH